MFKESLIRQLTDIKAKGIEFEITSNNSSLGGFEKIVFKQNTSTPKEVKVVFSDYIIHPYDGFDLHEKWNNNIAPPFATMYGSIVQETNGMYRFNLHDENYEKTWQGWCPKKSCVVINI